MIEKLKFKNFTAFEDLEIECSPGINIFIGENGTGKTHILKSVYSACEITKSKRSFADKITKVFLPSQGQTGRLVRRGRGSKEGSLEIVRRSAANEKMSLTLRFSNHTKTPDKAKVSGITKWNDESNELQSVYIPVKDMMANAPGFRSLYNLRDIHFEEVYADIIDRAFLSKLKGPTDHGRKKILTILQKSMNGHVVQKNEEFFLKNTEGELEFTLLAEGMRKLALLWTLLQNGTLLEGAVLCWDEPETNLNPKLMKTVIEILVELQRMGVQVFLTTHDYVILKQLDLNTNTTDQIIYHSLFRDKQDQKIKISKFTNYSDITPNSIDDTFSDLVSASIQKAMK